MIDSRVEFDAIGKFAPAPARRERNFATRLL
jgi:hypothetical protein